MKYLLVIVGIILSIIALLDSQNLFDGGGFMLIALILYAAAVLNHLSGEEKEK